MNLKISDNIKIALIGCGSWGKNIARNLSQMNVLSCVYDPHSNIAKQITNDLKLPTSLNNLITIYNYVVLMQYP